MNKIITLISDGSRLVNLNNLMGGENSEYAIFARKVRVGMGLIGGVAAACSVYKNAETVIGKSALLSGYQVAVQEGYALEMISFAAGAVSYGVSSCFGPLLCYGAIKSGPILEYVVKSGLKLFCLTLPYLIARGAVAIVIEMIKNVFHGYKLLMERQGIFAIAVMTGCALLIDPQTGWELLCKVSENYEVVLKAVDVTDRSRFLIGSLVISSLFFIQQIKLDQVKLAIQNAYYLTAFVCQREYYRLVSTLVITGLIIYNIRNMDLTLFNELYRVITE